MTDLRMWAATSSRGRRTTSDPGGRSVSYSSCRQQAARPPGAGRPSSLAEVPQSWSSKSGLEAAGRSGLRSQRSGPQSRRPRPHIRPGPKSAHIHNAGITIYVGNALADSLGRYTFIAPAPSRPGEETSFTATAAHAATIAPTGTARAALATAIPAYRPRLHASPFTRPCTTHGHGGASNQFTHPRRRSRPHARPHE